MSRGVECGDGGCLRTMVQCCSLASNREMEIEVSSTGVVVYVDGWRSDVITGVGSARRCCYQGAVFGTGGQ